MITSSDSELDQSYFSQRQDTTGCFDEIPTLPGHGEPGLGCGTPIPYHCSDCNTDFWVDSSCMSRECPNCMEKWASNEARFASWRTWTGSKRRCHDKMWAWRDCRVLHGLISIPDVGQGIEASRKQAIRVAKKHHLDGGLMVYHPFRQEESSAFVQDGFVHYHIVALAHGDVLPGGTDDGIIFKVIKDAEFQDYRGFVGPLGIRRVVHYLMSHCGILEGRHALTWWGSLSYNMLSNGFLKESYPEAWKAVNERPNPRCPSCGSRNTEPVNTPQDIGWGSERPIHHSPFASPPWKSP